MRRKEPHFVHFREFEILEISCKRLLGQGDLKGCFDKLQSYFDYNGFRSNEDSKMFLMLQSQNSEIKKSEKILEPIESLNFRKQKLTNALLDFISEIKPQGYDNYEGKSLRRKSKWNEEENLTIYLQFDRDFSSFDRLFNDLTKKQTESEPIGKWHPHIAIRPESC